MMTEQELKDMKLHDYIEIDLKIDFSFVHRVPNGWNYLYCHKGKIAVQFVPEITILQEHVEPRLR